MSCLNFIGVELENPFGQDPGSAGGIGRLVWGSRFRVRVYIELQNLLFWRAFVQIILVAEWIHFTLFGLILPTIKLKVYTFWVL